MKSTSNTTPAKNQTAAPEPPAEEVLFRALRERFTRLHDGVTTRTALTPEDDADLERIVSEAAGACRVARSEWTNRRTWAPGGRSEPAYPAEIEGAIAEYVLVNRSRVELKLDLGDGESRPIQAPSIESAAVRGALATRGARILDLIDTAITSGRERVSKDAAERQVFADGIRFWRDNRVTRGLFETLDALAEGQSLNDLILHHAPSVIRAVNDTTTAIWRRDEANTPLPLFGIHTAIWWPAMREALHESRVGR